MYDYPGPLVSLRLPAERVLTRTTRLTRSMHILRVNDGVESHLHSYRSGEESQTHVESVKASKKAKPG